MNNVPIPELTRDNILCADEETLTLMLNKYFYKVDGIGYYGPSEDLSIPYYHTNAQWYPTIEAKNEAYRKLLKHTRPTLTDKDYTLWINEDAEYLCYWKEGWGPIVLTDLFESFYARYDMQKEIEKLGLVEKYTLNVVKILLENIDDKSISWRLLNASAEDRCRGILLTLLEELETGY